MSHIRAVDPKTILPWYPKVDMDLPEAERFTIMYQYLDMRQAAEVDDAQFKNIQKRNISEMKYMISAADIKRMEMTIKGWKNLTYPEGHPKAGTECLFAVDNITCIPSETRREYVNFITGRDKETEEETELGEAKPA